MSRAHFEIRKDHGVPARRIGTVSDAGGDLRIETARATVRADSAALLDACIDAIPRITDAPQTAGL